MLVLTRKAGESLTIGEDITIKVLNVKYRQVQIGIQAPQSVCILRDDAKQTQRDPQSHPACAQTGCLPENTL